MPACSNIERLRAARVPGPEKFGLPECGKSPKASYRMIPFLRTWPSESSDQPKVLVAKALRTGSGEAYAACTIQMVRNSDAGFRYSRACPACGATIRPSDMGGESFPCPTCGEWLEIAHKYSPLIWVVSAIAATVLTLHFGYRDATFIFATGCATALLGLSGIFIKGILGLTKLQRVQGRPFDRAVSLHLTDKPDDHKKTEV